MNEQDAWDEMRERDWDAVEAFVSTDNMVQTYTMRLEAADGRVLKMPALITQVDFLRPKPDAVGHLNLSVESSGHVQIVKEKP